MSPADIEVAAPIETPAAPVAAPEPAKPETPAAPIPRRETIRLAVDAAKAKAASVEGKPDATARPVIPSDKPRAADGKFAPINPGAPADVAAATGREGQATANLGAPAQETAAVRPPPGWSPAAKVAFDKADPAIRDAVARREEEVNKGFARLAEWKPVERFAEMAKASGTTLDKALESYVGIEQLLRRDPFAGIDAVLKNAGLNPQSFLTAYAQRASGQPQEPQQQARQQAIDPQAIVRQATEAVRAEYEQRQIDTDLQRFAADPKNRFFENVKPTMGKLIQAGVANTLEDAYSKACALDPAISAIIKESQAPDPRIAAATQAKLAARATIGAPAAGAIQRPAVPSNQPRRAMIASIVEGMKGGARA